MSTTVEPKFNYTGFATEGKKYRETENLDISDIAKLVKKQLKEKYPKCRFSIRIQRYAGGQAMDVYLTHVNFNPFADPSEEVASNPQVQRGIMATQEVMDHWERIIENGHHGINEYHINTDYVLNEEGKQIAKDMINVTEQYNFDDSDGMIDYFHVNFYSHFGIGKWDKPLQIIQ